jgi:hypothetical protein
MNPVTLVELYRKLPGIPCKGLCVDSCGPVAVGAAEHRRMTAAGGPFTYQPETERCGYLVDGRCTVYRDRPFICRLWGVEESMRCPYGCVPDRVVPHDEGVALLERLAGRWVWPTYTVEGKTYIYRP